MAMNQLRSRCGGGHELFFVVRSEFLMPAARYVNIAVGAAGGNNRFESTDVIGLRSPGLKVKRSTPGRVSTILFALIKRFSFGAFHCVLFDEAHSSVVERFSRFNCVAACLPGGCRCWIRCGGGHELFFVVRSEFLMPAARYVNIAVGAAGGNNRFESTDVIGLRSPGLKVKRSTPGRVSTILFALIKRFSFGAFHCVLFDEAHSSVVERFSRFNCVAACLPGGCRSGGCRCWNTTIAAIAPFVEDTVGATGEDCDYTEHEIFVWIAVVRKLLTALPGGCPLQARRLR